MTSDGISTAPVASTRDLILDAADKFLVDHPFRDLTVSGLMQATSVSRPAFYQYFRDRYDIAAALIERIMEATMPFAGWFEDQSSGSDVLATTIHDFVLAVAPHAYVMRAICDAAAADDRIEKMWRHGAVQRYIEGVDRRIQVDQVAGRIGADLDAEMTARALVMLTVGFVCDCLGKSDCRPPEEFATTLSHIWVATLYG